MCFYSLITALLPSIDFFLSKFFQNSKKGIFLSIIFFVLFFTFFFWLNHTYCSSEMIVRINDVSSFLSVLKTATVLLMVQDRVMLIWSKKQQTLLNNNNKNENNKQLTKKKKKGNYKIWWLTWEISCRFLFCLSFMRFLFFCLLLSLPSPAFLTLQSLNFYHFFFSSFSIFIRIIIFCLFILFFSDISFSQRNIKLIKTSICIWIHALTSFLFY